MRIFVSLVLLLCCYNAVDAQCRVIQRRPVTTIVSSHRVIAIAPIAIPVAVPVFIPTTTFQYVPAVQPIAVAPVQPVTVNPHAVSVTPNSAGSPPLLTFPGDTPGEEDLPAQVANMLSSYSCVKCHTTGGPTPIRGGVSLFNQEGQNLVFQPNVDSQRILDAISGDRPRMPPSALGNLNHPDAVRQTDVALLKRWVNSK